MTVGQTFDSPIHRFTDKRTGRTVWKVSAFDEHHCAATYMYYQAMTPDDRYVIYASDRTGQFELYRMDLESETTTQLTQRVLSEGVNDKGLIRSHADHERGEVFYVDGPTVHAIDLATLQSRLVAGPLEDDPCPNFVALNTLSPDGYLIGKFIGGEGRHGIARSPIDGTNRHEPLFVIDNPSLSIAHVTVSPQGDVIAFNIVPDKQNHADMPHDLRARCWGWRAADGKVFNLLTLPPGSRATHETWGDDNRLYFHHKSVPDWTPTSIDSIASDGSDIQVHFRSRDRKLGHSCVSHDLKWIVSDVQDEAGNELYLIDRATGESEILCWPDSRMLDGVTGHVHPTFSRSGRFIVYTSDRTGKAAVFLVPLA